MEPRGCSVKKRRKIHSKKLANDTEWMVTTETKWQGKGKRENGKMLESNINEDKENETIKEQETGNQKKKMEIKKKEDRWEISTWNVRGINREGALKELVRELRRYNIHIAAIQETKQKDTNIIEVEDYIFLSSGDKSKIHGVGFMVHKSLKSAVVQFIPVSKKLCSL